MPLVLGGGGRGFACCLGCGAVRLSRRAPLGEEEEVAPRHLARATTPSRRRQDQIPLAARRRNRILSAPRARHREREREAGVEREREREAARSVSERERERS
jgi:hypothetical protein